MIKFCTEPMQYEYHTVILFESKLAQSPVHDAKWSSISSTSSPKDPPFMANCSQASVPSASPAVTPNNNLIIWKSMLIILNHQTWHPNIPSSSPSMLQKYPAPISDDNAAEMDLHGKAPMVKPVKAEIPNFTLRYRLVEWNACDLDAARGVGPTVVTGGGLLGCFFFSQRWKGRGKL